MQMFTQHSIMPFGIQSLGKFKAQKSYGTEREGREDYLLLYTVAGAGELVYNNSHFILSEGTVAVVDCRRYHKYNSCQDASGNWVHYFMHIDNQNCHVYYDMLFREQYMLFYVADELKLSEIFDEAIKAAMMPNIETPCYLSNYVSKIMTLLLDCKNSVVNINNNNNKANEEKTHKAVNYIREKYDMSISVEEIAAHVEVSKYHFIRMFKRILGVTPYQYILFFRINEAKRLLRNTNYTASRISGMVGFSDECNFNTTFKRITGMTPILYKTSVEATTGISTRR